MMIGYLAEDIQLFGVLIKGKFIVQTEGTAKDESVVIWK